MSRTVSLEELKKIKISVVITSYNQKEFLIETIESALNQTLKPYEIIIADDHSTDGSVELIEQYTKQYPDLIKPIFHEKNLGIAKNRNSAFRKATGDFVSWINGDDRLLPRKLELELKTYLNNPKAKWIYSQVYSTDSEGRRMNIRFRGKYRTNAYSFGDVVTRIGIDPTYHLIDRSILDEVDLFDENLESYEDWDFVIRLAKSYDFAYCPIPLSEYRQHGGGASKADKGTHLRSVKKIYQNVLPLLEGIPEREAKSIKRIFTSEIFRIEALRKLEENKKFQSVKYLMKAIKNNPQKTSFYMQFVLVCLPNRVSNLLRALFQKYKYHKYLNLWGQNRVGFLGY